MRIKRAGGGGFYLSGRRRYLKIRWLNPGVHAIEHGIWQRQVGRLLVRLSWQWAAKVQQDIDRCRNSVPR